MGRDRQDEGWEFVADERRRDGGGEVDREEATEESRAVTLRDGEVVCDGAGLG